MSQPHVHSAAAHNRAQADFRQKQRVALLGGAVNLPLAILKITVGYFGASQALIADGIDSSADIVCDLLVFGAVRVSGQRADMDHPYGHARIETVATTLIALMLLLTAAVVGYRGVTSLLAPGSGTTPAVWTLVVAAISVMLKEGMFWYTLHVGRKARSALIESNAWHHRSDALTSSVALGAIVGAMLGFQILDAIGAIIIACVIATIGLRYGWQSFRELVDTGLEPERLDVVRMHIGAVPGVRRIRRLRTRTMGGHDAFADVGVFVDPLISLTEAHRISEAVTTRLVRNVDEIADINIHIEPDGHADSAAAYTLPLREDVLERLAAAWVAIDAAAHIERVTLHYLDDRIVVELLLPLAYAADQPQLQPQFDAVAAAVANVSTIRLLFAAAIGD